MNSVKKKPIQCEMIHMYFSDEKGTKRLSMKKQDAKSKAKTDSKSEPVKAKAEVKAPVADKKSKKK